MQSEQTTFRAVEGILATVINDETILFSSNTGNYIALDNIGGDIWARLQTPISIADLMTALCASYDEDPVLIAEHVARFLTALEKAGLIVALT